MCNPPQAALGGGASSELLIPHRDSRRRASVRSGPRRLRMLSFHKRKWRPEGGRHLRGVSENRARANGGSGGLGGCQQEEEQQQRTVCEW